MRAMFMANAAKAYACWLLLGLNSPLCAAPISVDPVNPHYLDVAGKATVLIGASEHYGAVINGDFDYIRYLDALKAVGLNATRVFSGQYRERPGPFGRTLDVEIVENSLAPNANAFVAPWRRSSVPGAADGKNRFDLTKWNDAYFERLQRFVRAAEERGIVVEVSLFSPYYADVVGTWFWDISPLNAKNNVNGIGAVEASEVLSLKDAPLLAIEESLVRRIVEALARFDNVYFEICNEPWHDNVSHDWQSRIGTTIAATEADLPRKHLIAEEFLSATERDSHSDLGAIGPLRRVEFTGLAALHNALDRDIARDYDAGVPIGQNEFVGGAFAGDQAPDEIVRTNAWRLILSGAAFDVETDYSFVRNYEDGSFAVPEGGAGGGNSSLRAQLAVLLRFANALPLREMRPSASVIPVTSSASLTIRALEWKGHVYVVYICQGGGSADGLHHHSVDSRRVSTKLAIALPSGRYVATWMNARSGVFVKEEIMRGGATPQRVESPFYSEDIVLRIVKDRWTQ